MTFGDLSRLLRRLSLFPLHSVPDHNSVRVVSFIELSPAMTTVVLPMEHCKPPPYSQLYTPQVVVVPQPAQIQYKCLYLAVLIVNLIGSIIVGCAVLVTIFASSIIESALQHAAIRANGYSDYSETIGGYSIVNHGNVNNELASSAIWVYQAIAVVILFAIIAIQYYGWKGYNHHNVKAIYIFAVDQFFWFIIHLFVLCYWFTMWTLLTAALTGSFVYIPLLFANEIKKHQSGLQTV